jgi:itaconate CoA-transferase
LKPQVVLSMEQALTMTYATLRCVHLGWRVIRVEPTSIPGIKSKGDPSRYVGRPFAGQDRHSYFIAPNLGKEAIAIDLKQPEGRDLLKKLIVGLNVDVFCTNTMPQRHEQLGLDYNTLRLARDDLIWCSISAMGLAYPDVPGYDPVLQAMCGYMDLTGYGGGPPLLSGIPVVDLKAGDEAFTQILLALMERAETGKGKLIDISMAQAAVSWLHTFLPMLDMSSPPSELKRAGNAHRQFVPVNVFQTSDGFIYLAIGSDPQWARTVKTEMFSSLNEEKFATNEDRRRNKAELRKRMEAITKSHTSEEITGVLAAASIPNSTVTPIEEVFDLPFVASRVLKTVSPDGKEVRLPPPPVLTDHLDRLGGKLPFAPGYGEHTDALLGEIGVSSREIEVLRSRGVVA